MISVMSGSVWKRAFCTSLSTPTQLVSSQISSARQLLEAYYPDSFSDAIEAGFVQGSLT